MVTGARRGAAPIQPEQRWEDLPRIDARDKVTGEALYLDDLPVPDGTAHAAVLRSPYSHARIVRYDASKALALPGVIGILDREHLYGLDPETPLSEFETPPEAIPGEHVLLATDRVRFDGDLIAMVVAEDRATADRAIEEIEVEYEILPTVFSYREALANGAPLLHERLGTNVAFRTRFEWGDVDRAFAEADRVFERTWYGGTVFHYPMEPAVPCIVDYVGDHIDLIASVQKSFTVAPRMANLLFGIPREDVRVRVPEVGGGFGSKEITPTIMAAAALSHAFRRPVKYVARPHDSFRNATRHAIEYRAKMGVRRDGTIVALEAKVEIDTGAYFTGAAAVTHNSSISAWGCYRLPNFRVIAESAYTNRVPSSAFRGTGKNQTTFGIECTMDSIAREIGLDPIEFRKRNVLRRGEYVADTWKVNGEEFMADVPPLDTDYVDLMERATRGIGWDGHVNPSRPAPVGSERVVRGRGLALSLRHGSQGGGRAHALLELEETGILNVHHNAPDPGTGTRNVFAVVAAHCLGIPQSQVRVHFPDSGNRMPFGGTSAQRTTVQMGNAVRAAAENLKKELAAAAAQLFGGEPVDWRVGDGRVWRADRSHVYADVIRRYHGHEAVSICAVGAYSYAPSSEKAFGGLDSWGPGCAAAEVEVDLETGRVRIVRYAAVGDAGKVLHRASAEGQIRGGAIMGMGIALTEDLVYADGQLLNGDPFQYRLPLIDDVPEWFHVELVENFDGPGPFGAKGLGQTSLPCVAPAVGNAIRDAIGVHIASTPFTPEKILRALGKIPSTAP